MQMCVPVFLKSSSKRLNSTVCLCGQKLRVVPIKGASYLSTRVPCLSSSRAPLTRTSGASLAKTGLGISA